MTASPRPTRVAGAGGAVAAVAGAAPCGGVGWLGGDGRVQAASTAAIPMLSRSRAPRVLADRIVRLQYLGPTWVRAAPCTPPAPDRFPGGVRGCPVGDSAGSCSWLARRRAHRRGDAGGGLGRDRLRRAGAAERPQRRTTHAAVGGRSGRSRGQPVEATSTVSYPGSLTSSFPTTCGRSSKPRCQPTPHPTAAGIAPSATATARPPPEIAGRGEPQVCRQPSVAAVEA